MLHTKLSIVVYKLLLFGGVLLFIFCVLVIIITAICKIKILKRQRHRMQDIDWILDQMSNINSDYDIMDDPYDIFD